MKRFVPISFKRLEQDSTFFQVSFKSDPLLKKESRPYMASVKQAARLLGRMASLRASDYSALEVCLLRPEREPIYLSGEVFMTMHLVCSPLPLPNQGNLEQFV